MRRFNAVVAGLLVGSGKVDSFIHSSASYCTTQSKKWKNTPSVVGKKSLMDKLAIVGDMDGAMKEMSTAKGGFQLI